MHWKSSTTDITFKSPAAILYYPTYTIRKTSRRSEPKHTTRTLLSCVISPPLELFKGTGASPARCQQRATAYQTAAAAPPLTSIAPTSFPQLGNIIFCERLSAFSQFVSASCSYSDHHRIGIVFVAGSHHVGHDHPSGGGPKCRVCTISTILFPIHNCPSLRVIHWLMF